MITLIITIIAGVIFARTIILWDKAQKYNLQNPPENYKEESTLEIITKPCPKKKS